MSDNLFGAEMKWVLNCGMKKVQKAVKGKRKMMTAEQEKADTRLHNIIKKRKMNLDSDVSLRRAVDVHEKAERASGKKDHEPLVKKNALRRGAKDKA